MQTIQLDRPVTADDAVLWENDALLLLDQRLLPRRVRFVLCEDAADTAEAIRAMVVRGAPAIGVTAAYGVVLAARDAWKRRESGWKRALAEPLALLAGARPTAVNLGWALKRMEALVSLLPEAEDPEPALLEEARLIHAKDVAANRRCPPWRAKRRRVVPGSREATRDARRAEGAKGDPKGASERSVQSYGRPVCSRNELAMLWRNAG